MEVNPTSASASVPSYQRPPVINANLVKTTVRVLPKDGVEQTTVYTYDKWGHLDTSVMYTKSILDKYI
jgi:hypothetical protein